MEKTQLNKKEEPKVVDFFQNIIDKVPMGGLFVDKGRSIRYCNDAVEKIFGYSKDEVLGKKTDILYGDRRQDKSDKNEIYNRLANYGYHIGRAQGLSKDRLPLNLTLYTFIVKDGTGAAILIEEAGRRPERATVDIAQLLQDLMNNIPDMIYFKDADNRFVMVNKAHAAALNRTPQEVLGKTDLDFFPRELAEKYFADDMRVLKSGIAILDKIEKAARPDGGMTYVSTTKIPRFDSKGAIIGTIGITRNVTERMTAEEEISVYRNHLEELVKERTKDIEEGEEKLRRMYNMKSEFVATVSHELRTPLTVIKEGVEIVADETSGKLNENQKKFLGSALENIDRLSRLIDGILDFSKLENKKMEYRIIEGNLNELIGNILKSSEPLLDKKGLKLNKRLDPFLPLVRFDPDRITQVLYNLITNAIKFTEKGGIGVVSRRENGAVVVSVEDTGRGIEEKDLDRIFEKFEQVRLDAERKVNGTGLGLAICKQIIEQLGGRIWVESIYGKGSKFIFTLPLK